MFKVSEDGKHHICGLPHRYYRLHGTKKVRALIDRDDQIATLTAERDALETNLGRATESAKWNSGQYADCADKLKSAKATIATLTAELHELAEWQETAIDHVPGIEELVDALSTEEVEQPHNWVNNTNSQLNADTDICTRCGELRPARKEVE